MNTPTIDNDSARIEAMLEPLIREHGIELVRQHLEKLIGSGNWSDWQRVDAIAQNVARRIGR